jgi:hypothetical protein
LLPTEEKSTNQEKERNQKRAYLKRGGRTETLIVFFLLLQVTVVVTAGRERKRRSGLARSRCFQFLPYGGACTHAPTVAVARGEDAPLFSCSSRSLPDTVPVVQKVFPVNSRLFWGYYCNFNVIFV